MYPALDGVAESPKALSKSDEVEMPRHVLYLSLCHLSSSCSCFICFLCFSAFFDLSWSHLLYKNIFVYTFFWTRKPFPQKGASRLQLLPVAYLLCLLLLSSSIFTIFTSSLGHPPITSEVMAGIKLRSLCHERSSKERKVHGPTGLRSDWSPVGIRAPKSSRVVTPESSEHVLLMLLVS